MKIMTVVGTRPEIIRLSCVLELFDSTDGIDSILVSTGQNWDHKLSQVFFDELELRPPDHRLEVDTSSLGAVLGDTFRKIEKVLLEERPDAFLVLGDTNSALSLIMAKRLHIPTYHMEAGNRCFDTNVPEETNRRILDHSADFNLAYTEQARRNLLLEGAQSRRVIVTGSPMNEVLDRYRTNIERSTIVSRLDLEPGGYFLVSAHREENVDSPQRLNLLLEALTEVAATWQLPVLVSTHPRTQQRIGASGRNGFHQLIHFHEPFGFFDYNHLQKKAVCVLSDSGTIAEEASLLGFRAVTLRSAIERPEALETGVLQLVDLDPKTVVNGIRRTLDRFDEIEIPPDYTITNTSHRVLNFILSTAPQHKQWSGLR